MEDLIKALQIFMKYKNDNRPTYCIEEELFVDVDPGLVSGDDKEKLEALSFMVSDEEPGFYSLRFGSY